jgi:ABC-2 type transport system ATP-binding protein
MKSERREVLRDLCLEVSEREIVCVLGRNGSGKTTLTRILSTLIEPDRGEVKVCGFDARKNGREVRRRVGVMLNAGEGGFHPRLSGFSNLEYYAALHQIPMGEAKVRIAGLLKTIGLGDRGRDQYQSYSSGMRRRMALVRALLSDPLVLLLDEPTLGVDPWSTDQIQKNLLELSEGGKTILCTTNNLGEAQALGNRVLLLEDGALSLLESAKVRTA